jgi:hypothetical protein
MTDYQSLLFPVDGIDGFGPAPSVSGWLFAPQDIEPGKVRDRLLRWMG